ncbi:MAG: hypothetical protein BWZ02_02329 [Lentisphaerae bacterium ADurb.BinA184]|nr:MAG: hypothetical protein BWZ02_02329 [Lentisphaerae bacterium ADurb.BinA184]
MGILKGFLGLQPEPDKERDKDAEPAEPAGLLHGEDEARREHDKSILGDDDGTKEEKLRQLAEKEVQTAAESSLRRLHVLQLGRCPSCGEHLRRHLFASVCEACGWHAFDTPGKGPVRVFLRHENRTIEGDHCYTVKDGTLLVLKDDRVIAKIARAAYDSVEYVWSDSEIEQRRRQIAERMNLVCGWCAATAEPGKEGFHLVHVAFGSTQERYCFCSDDCFEAFRRMYPARVHRNCYERDCDTCELCTKRYVAGSEGMNVIAKDFLTPPRSR